MDELSQKIRNIPDFPKKGIAFKDITPLLQDASSFKRAILLLAKHYRNSKISSLVSVESRGFILGAALAYELGVGFIPVRKPGKLPYRVKRISYSLEYGEDTIEIHEDAIEKGEKVLVVDDLIATGGTVQAVCKLVEKLGGVVVGICFLVELTYLKGREKLKDYDIFSLIKFR